MYHCASPSVFELTQDGKIELALEVNETVDAVARKGVESADQRRKKDEISGKNPDGPA
jgi:hypothetical protein